MATCSICNTTIPANSSTCPKCASQEFAMVEVERRKSSGPCLNTETECEDTDKWYDLTTGPFSVPAIGGSIDVSVCDATRYTAGQWVFVSGAGVFYITAVNENGTITLKNSCLDGVTEILGNAAAATLISEGAKLWIVGEPGWPECLEDGGTCDEVLGCLATQEDICFSSVEDADEAVEHPLFVGTEDDFCAKKLPSIYAKDNALGYDNRTSIGGAKTVSGGTPTAKQFVVQDFATKQDHPLTVANDANGFWKYVDGGLTFITGGTVFVPHYANILTALAIPLVVGSTAHVTSVLPSFPSGASQVLLHVQAFATTSVSADYFVYKIKIGGRDVLIYGGNEQFEAAGVLFPAHNDNTVIIPVSSDAALTINNEVVDATTAGLLDLKAWVLGYYV